MTPDRQVQEAIRAVFAHFERLGSVRQVLLWYRQENMPLCSFQRGRDAFRQVVWKAPVYNHLRAILTNPIYAGAFAYGKTRTCSRMVEGRARKTSGHALPLEQWSVLIHDHHPGYISWEDYMRNQKRLAQNTSQRRPNSQGAAKAGPALLAGLLRCARCGRKLHVSYGGVDGRVPRYECRRAHDKHGAALCVSFGGLRADEAVAGAVLEALQPVGVEAALSASQHLSQAREQKLKAMTLALDKARYEADRARRQYDAVEPENRLVAAELEARWNVSLLAVAEVQKNLNQAREADPPPSQEEIQRLLHLGSELQRLWDHAQTPLALKKRVLRAVLQEIVVEVDEAASEVLLRLHWVGGAHTTARVQKNRKGKPARSNRASILELVRELAQTCPDSLIASILKRLGYQTERGDGWTQARVAEFRRAQNIPGVPQDKERCWVTQAQACQELAVSAGVIKKLVAQKILPAKQVVPRAPWIINRADLHLPAVQKHVAAARKGKPVPQHDSNQSDWSFL